MNINDSEQIKKRIEEEYNNNCSKIEELETKIWLLQRSGFEMKFALAFVLSIIPWMVTVSAGKSILKLGLIPLELTKPLFIAVPALLGTIASTIIHKKQKINEKVKEFSSAKTTREKIEEEARYKIEQEKLRSYNKMLKKNYEDLESNERLISSLSNKYNIASKESDTRTKEEVEENIENVKKLLEERTNDMYIATTRHTLSNLFWTVRSKLDKFNDATICGCMGMIVCMFLYNIPMNIANTLEGIQFQTSILGVLAPAIIGGIACTGYGFKRTHDRLCAFKNINNELGENAISESKNLNIKEDFEQEKNKVINDICVIRMQLESEKRKLKHVSETTSELQIHSEAPGVEIGYEKSETPLEDMMSFMEESIFEDSSKEQGPVMKKTINRRNNNKTIL